jgi:hypothetical protein
MWDDIVLEHFSPRNRPFISLEQCIELIARTGNKFQVYWRQDCDALAQDFREDAPIPAQPIKWETIGQLVDRGILIYNYKHSWERIKRWYVSPEWLTQHPAEEL